MVGLSAKQTVGSTEGSCLRCDQPRTVISETKNEEVLVQEILCECHRGQSSENRTGGNGSRHCSALLHERELGFRITLRFRTGIFFGDEAELETNARHL